MWRFKPRIIAVTGNVGKTSAKDSIYTALSKSLYIRKNQKSFNSEIGTPLTILGLQNAWNSPLLWTLNILKGALVPFTFKYPKWLVLEVGVDRPGDIDRVAKWLKPDIAVFTTFPTVPVHVEYFNSPEDVIKEKKKLIKYLKVDGELILNADDPKVLKCKEDSKRKVVTYGIHEPADVTLTHDSVIYEDFEGLKVPTGISFRVNYGGNSVPVALHGVLGVQHMYPVISAIATGLSIGIPFLDMTSALGYHKPPLGRMNLIDGINRSTIIDDSYNASPVAMEKAIDALSSLEISGQKIAVLGDMLEIGHFSAREHKRIGEYVANNKINHLFAIGLRSKDIARSAIESGMNESNVHWFNKSEEAIEEIQKLINPGSAILVKGSQGIRTEKIVVGIMKDPSRRKELLVRQEDIWGAK